jgi:beta-galactosidase
MKIIGTLIAAVILSFNLYAQAVKKVSEQAMQKIYQEVKTPYKYGLVMVPPDATKKIDCPTIFREGKKWFMTYLIFDGRGYETWLAQSDDLLKWSTMGKIMSFGDSTKWDGNQNAGYLALQDTKWGGSYALQKYDGKYWMSYFGGAVRGYEAGDLSIGIASTAKDPWVPHEWDRLGKPVFTAKDTDVRWWENRKLFKSTVVWDKAKTTGYPFVMYYNANGDSAKNNVKTRWFERIGMAVSNDMVNWKRFHREPVMHHPVGITGDAVLQKMDDIWVMFYFGAFWTGTKGAFNRFACSYDMVNWTDWTGDDLIKSSEPYDERFAHKSYVVKYKGVVYHYYCAVDKADNRGIAVATSVDLGKSTLAMSAVCVGSPRTISSFNQDWKFFSGDDDKAREAVYDDSKWRVLNLPHDWSIEGAFDEKSPATQGGGGLPTGIGWYRKTFVLPAGAKDKNICIDFDGIYRNSEVWINGHYLGKRPYGYSSFHYDLTPFLNFGDQKNVIAVKVDNTEQPNSRWYTGSGIYRNVWMITTGNIHVDHWGTFVTTPQVSKDKASVNLEVSIKRSSWSSKSAKTGKPVTISVISVICNASGNKVAEKETPKAEIKDSTVIIHQDFSIANPILWSVDIPYLYKIVTTVYEDNKPIDSYETPLGIRFFEFDAQKGFSLNGKPLKIKGVCNHHDLGALGAAVNTRAIQRQLEILKSMGCNAIRTSHNPPAPELLDLCDRMGFIVMDEAFDMWKKKKNKQDYHIEFEQWHKTDLETMILRDRNHPSIFIWSIGNEIREQFDTSGIRYTRELASIVKALDRTRPVTSALTENDASKNFIYQSGALDILGFNYKEDSYANLPSLFPGQKFFAAETMSALATRGHYDMPSDSLRLWPKDSKTPYVEGNPDYTVSAYDHVMAYWGSTHEKTWNIVKKLDHMAGMFLWTAFDFIGEPVPYAWPARSSYYGVIDLCGFPKDAFYMYQSEWTNTTMLHLFPHWNWKPGQTVDVWAYYNNADEVELFLNGKSLGIRKKEGDALHVMWRVAYTPGTLMAVSRRNGQTVLTSEIKTAGKPAKIELSADRKNMKADGSDLSFVTVTVLDKDGNMVPDADNLINFSLQGEGFIAGVDNGYQASMEPFKANYRKAFNGMCLAILQSNGKAGKITFKAEAEGLEGKSLVVECK